MISEILLPMLKQRFPDRGLKVGVGSEPCVRFPAIHPEVGDIVIEDDGDEITIYAGNFTHGHFSNYDEISTVEKEKRIAEDVAAFLERLFSDHVVLWGSHKSGGGWRDISAGENRRVKFFHRIFHPFTVPREFVWSGPRNSAG